MAQNRSGEVGQDFVLDVDLPDSYAERLSAFTGMVTVRRLPIQVAEESAGGVPEDLSPGRYRLHYASVAAWNTVHQALSAEAAPTTTRAVSSVA